MMWPYFLRFAGEASWLVYSGLGLLALSALAAWGDYRRLHRRNIDAVGVMPWRDLSAMTSFAGLVLLAVGLLGWIGG